MGEAERKAREIYSKTLRQSGNPINAARVLTHAFHHLPWYHQNAIHAVMVALSTERADA